MGFSSISARVAEDLDESNEFWSSIGFNAGSLVTGGKTTNRKLIIRVIQLQVPSLFDSLDNKKAKGIAEHLKFQDAPLHQKRTFAIDLNIYLDITKERDRYDHAASILRSSLSGNFELCVTEEMLNELHRNTEKYVDDPIYEFAKNLPVLPIVDKRVLEPQTDRLRKLIFPEKPEDALPTPQDLSDLTHLAISIHHEVDGFITRDRAILASSKAIEEEFGLEILSSSDFSPIELIPKSEGLNPIINENQTRTVRELRESDRPSVRNFLEGLGIDQSSIREALKPGSEREPSRRFVLKIDDEVFGLASWRVPSPMNKEAQCYLFVNEEVEASLLFVEHILESYAREVSFDNGRCLFLFLSASQVATQSIADKSMYTSAPDHSGDSRLICLRKFAVSGIVTMENWGKFTQSLSELVGVKLPDQMPNHDLVQRNGIKTFKNNNKVDFIDLYELETYLSNVLVLFPSREGILIPIKPAYSEELLGKADDQRLLFGNFDAWLKVERTYFRKPMASSKAKNGDPVIFYSSARAKAAIICGRVTFSRVARIESIDAQISKTGVLTAKELRDRANKDGNVHMISFDGFQQFVNPVELQKLREFGAGQSNFQTIERLEPETLKQICQLGFGYVEE